MKYLLLIAKNLRRNRTRSLLTAAGTIILVLVVSLVWSILSFLDAATTENNLRKMVEIARARGVSVVLIAVPEPVFFGGSAAFYEAIARDFSLPLEDGVLNDILRDNALKSDPIHPNAEGYRRLAHAVAELLREAGAI